MHCKARILGTRRINAGKTVEVLRSCGVMLLAHANGQVQFSFAGDKVDDALKDPGSLVSKVQTIAIMGFRFSHGGTQCTSVLHTQGQTDTTKTTQWVFISTL